MATFIDRVDELISLLGMSQRQFTMRLGYQSRSTYTNWKNGSTSVDKALEQIAKRWLVSVDSLMGMPGTTQLEPAPALRLVQDELLWPAGRKIGSSATVTDRILTVQRATSRAGMSPEAWCEWLQLHPTTWADMAQRNDFGTPQIRQTAFLAGWYHDQRAWMDWIRTGSEDVLATQSDRTVTRVAQALVRSGYTYPDIQRKLLS